MRRLVAVAVLASAVASGCAWGAEQPEPSSIGPSIPGVRFPELPPVDAGVLHIGPPASADSRGEDLTAEDGLRYELDSCTLRAPAQWVMQGHVELPEDAENVDAVVSLSLDRGDQGYGIWMHHVTFRESGDFAVAAENTSSSGVGGILPSEDDADACSMSLWGASAPIAADAVDDVHLVRPTVASDPFVYEAPSDSVQALGIGAPLADHTDPRTVSLYTVWSSRTAEVADVWVPNLPGEFPALSGLKSSEESPCAAMWVELYDAEVSQRVAVTTSERCDAPGELEELSVTGESVDGAPGFVWARGNYPGGERVAVREDGVVQIRVTGDVATPRGRIARVAASLEQRRNLARPETIPARPATLDAAIAALLAEHDGTSERARFRYHSGWMIVIEGHLESDVATAWEYTFVRAVEVTTGRWIERDGGGGGSEQRCLVGPTGVGGGTGGDAYSFAITGDADWGIEGYVAGEWRVLPSTNGVLFSDRTVADPTPMPIELCPIDADGRVLDCYRLDHPEPRP